MTCMMYLLWWFFLIFWRFYILIWEKKKVGHELCYSTPNIQYITAAQAKWQNIHEQPTFYIMKQTVKWKLPIHQDTGYSVEMNNCRSWTDYAKFQGQHFDNPPPNSMAAHTLHSQQIQDCIRTLLWQLPYSATLYKKNFL